MKEFLTSLTLLAFTTTFAQTSCKKCDIEKVKIADSLLDNLTFEIVRDFLCTFDTSCKNNAEFSEWSNEVLFEVLEKSPSIYFKVIAKGQVNSKILLEEVQNPIHEFDYQKIYDKIKATNARATIKSQYLNALIVAADKEKLKIKK